MVPFPRAQCTPKNVYYRIALFCCLSFIAAVHGNAQNIPAPRESLVAEDGSTWERVSDPGFGAKDNIAIVDLCAYQDSLYAVTRNHGSGFELWRTNGASWEQVTVPGFTDSPYHGQMNNSYGDMTVFDGSLYVGVGSSVEGTFLYNSAGLEIWRFDGAVWEPVISNSRDSDESGAITAIAGCSDDDGATTAELTDSTKNWNADQWRGGVLRITSGDGAGRVFNIIANTATALTVQQNEESNTEDAAGTETEHTVCAEFAPDSSHEELAVGTVAVGDSYAIGMGWDENGFGEIWNKNIIHLQEFSGELYAAIGHNYEDGSRIWKTADGLDWEPMTDYSFGLFHGYDPAGDPTGVCLINGVEDRNGNPVSSSATHFAKSAVSGIETLYIGATGTTGCNGRGARVLRLDNGTWDYIVDNFVDENDLGTNENGFGDASSSTMANWQAWSWANYDEALIVGIARMAGGGRLMYTRTGSEQDGSWQYLVGGGAAWPDGFDGVSGALGYGSNIGTHLEVFNNALYAGTLANAYSPALFAKKLLDGADLWRGTGPLSSMVWSRITGDGFGDPTVINFSSLCSFNGSLYVAASNLFGNFKENTLEGFQGAKVYRLKEVPSLAKVSWLGAWPEQFKTVINWTTDNESDCNGFNVYRSTSSRADAAYTKINSDGLIKARGSASGGASYVFTDQDVRPNKTYYYKIEALSTGWESWGPLRVTTRRLFEKGAPSDSYSPLPEALDALESDALVEVQKITVAEWKDQAYYVFSPKDKKPEKGFIVYPGGKVKFEAYAPILHGIAASGYLCVLVQMPLDLAVFGYDRATLIMDTYSDITVWALGGHSFGGVMSCRYDKEFPGILAGVVLWASYPTSAFGNVGSAAKVISIYGTRDGLVTSDEVQGSEQDLPAGTQFVPVVGGNHTQFGWYDTSPYPVQYGDNPAVISREQQQEAMFNATLQFLEGL